MIKLKAYLFLFLFCASTVSSFATVHRCEGEITDFELFTLAECDDHHQKEEKSSCHSQCCESTDEKEDSCCDTSQLNDNESDIAKTIIQLVAFKSYLIKQKSDFTFISPNLEKAVLRYTNYFPPPIVRDIITDIQCFRI